VVSGTPTADRLSARSGPLLAVGAYLLWGVFPLYFKAVADVPALQVLAHRVVWSLVVVTLAIVVLRRTGAVAATFADRRRLAALFLAATLLAVNWGVFIHAVVSGRVLEASLGYFINPLVNVVLGVVVLGERLRPASWVAVALAACGVGVELFVGGTLPWITPVLALSFAGYGLMHKLAPTESLVALFTETALLAPLAFLYLIAVAFTGAGAFGSIDASTDALLILAGPVTALPLVLFVAAARRISFATLGLIQYVTPTAHFLLAILVFGEPIAAGRWAAFGLIWLALAVYSIDAVRGRASPAER
jgi:rarD protein